MIVDGKQTETEIIQETETEYPPDTGAAMAWLKNRKPEEWNKQPIRVDATSNGKDILPAKTLTQKEAVELLKNLNDGKFAGI